MVIALRRRKRPLSQWTLLKIISRTIIRPTRALQDKMHVGATLPSQALLNTRCSTTRSLPATGHLSRNCTQPEAVRLGGTSKLLPNRTFFGGGNPGGDDFHLPRGSLELLSWLATVNGLGTEVSAYWGAWSSRKRRLTLDESTCDYKCKRVCVKAKP